MVNRFSITLLIITWFAITGVISGPCEHPIAHDQKSESSPPFYTDTISDYEGNSYPVITVGQQQWMAVSLQSMFFRNGEAIPKCSDLYSDKRNAPCYYEYNNDAGLSESYGRLYTWYTLQDMKGLCPAGWRVPGDSDWQQLMETLDPFAWGNRNNAGIYLKSCRQMNSVAGEDCNVDQHPRWDYFRGRHGQDVAGFAALPSGYGYHGQFANLGKYSYLWSVTENDHKTAWARVLLHSHAGMSRSNYSKDFAFSVRCIKTEEGSSPTIITSSAVSIGHNQAQLTAKIVDDGGSEITSFGFIWGTSSDLQMDQYDHIRSISGSAVDYVLSIDGLLSDTTYYFRAWTSNNNGTALGNMLTLKTAVEPTYPKVITTLDFDLFPHYATGGGVVTHDGNLEVTSRGLVYSLNPDPDLGNNLGFTENNHGKGSFSSVITPLREENTYYVKAYATNALGTAYGEEITIVTPDFPNCGIVTDIDGNSYKTVLIGQHCYFRENLRTSRFRNGESITEVPEDAEWRNFRQPAWVNYNNNHAYDAVFGKLYNWYAVNDPRGLCPQGWRVTSYDDMQYLAEQLGGEALAGGKLKQNMCVGQMENALWRCPNSEATNASGFTALPHGYRLSNGYFSGLGSSAYWRTSTGTSNHSHQFYIYYDKEAFSSDLFGHLDGDAVRCVRE